MNWEIDTAAKRARLAPRKNPYWCSIAGGRGGVSLGYRRLTVGPGAWIAKIVNAGQRAEERIGIADDKSLAADAIGYRAAVALTLEWSVRQHATLEAKTADAPATRLTVRTAVEEYVRARKARSERGGQDAESRLAKHVLSDKPFVDTALTKLQAASIDEWRGRLPIRPFGVSAADAASEGLAPASVDRLLTDLRAALNMAAVRYRRQLPGAFSQEVRVGTKALGAQADARRQILTDGQIRLLVEAAFDVDDTGDFGRLVLLAAATGARFSQLAALNVGDLQSQLGRVLVPGSKKGRSKRARPPAPVPLSDETILRLLPATQGRGLSEPLLMRWQLRLISRYRWARDFRRKWISADEIARPWSEIVKRTGLPPDTVMYALRHSSIVRGLRAMLPVRLVAALHDTSVKMIEQHYAAFIVDATEDIARRATISFASGEVPLYSRDATNVT